MSEEAKIEKAFPLRWDSPTHHPDKRHLDWEGGRYLVAREAKGSRVFRAFLNGTRTAYYGTQEQCMKACERAIRQKRLLGASAPPTEPGGWHKWSPGAYTQVCAVCGGRREDHTDEPPLESARAPSGDELWHGVTVYHHANRGRFGVAGPHLCDGRVVVTWGRGQTSEERWADLRVAPPMPMVAVRVQGGVECYAPDYGKPGVRQRVEAEVAYAMDPKERR